MIKTLLLFLIIFSPQLFSQEKTTVAAQKIIGSKELPLELNLLIESLQRESSLSDKTIDSLLHIDSYAGALNKEDIFLLGKIEIYKTLLKSNISFQKATLDGNTVKTLRAAIKGSTDPFLIWFLKALLHDSESIMATPVFKEYLLQKNNGRLEQLSLRKIDKKVQLIYRWVSKINPDSADFEQILKTELMPVMLETVENIEQSFFLMTAGTSFGALPKIHLSTSEFKFFVLKNMPTAVAKPEKKEKTVDDILAPITDSDKAPAQSLPEPSKEDWLEDENAPTNLKNLPKPSDDADWLQDF